MVTAMMRRPLPGIRRLPGLLVVVVVATCLSFCVWQNRADALGTGAADCPGGRAAVGGLHLAGEGVTQGTLEQGGIVIYMDGAPVSFAANDGSNVINFIVGQAHRITIERKATYFRGFLFRLGGGTVPPFADTISVFSIDSSAVTPAVGLAAICVSNYGVGGVTHVDSIEKNTITFYVTMKDAGSFMPIDITVVQDVTPSVFYYSSLLANSVAATSAPGAAAVPIPPPTLAPVLVPQPTTLAPVVVPQPQPTTLAPVLVPQPQPTQSPVQQPLMTVSPTPATPTVWMPPFLRPSNPPVVAPIPPSTLAPVLVPQQTLAPVLVPQETLAPVIGQAPETLAPVIGPLPETLAPDIGQVPTSTIPTPVPTKTPLLADGTPLPTVAPNTEQSPSNIIVDSPTITPTPTVAPTPSATADDSTLVPTATFAPTVYIYALEEEFNGIQLTLDNVGSLDESAQLSFNEAMQSWYANYYYVEVVEDEEERRLRQRQRRSLQEDGTMGGFSTIVTYTGESTTASNNTMSNTITYDQIVTYSPPSGDDRNGRDLILEPFNRIGANRDLTAKLRESNVAFEPMNPNGLIRPPTVPEATPRSLPAEGLSSGAIIGIAVGSAVFVAFGAYLTYRYLDSRSKRCGVEEKEVNYDSVDKDLQPTSPARSATRSAASPSRAGAPVDDMDADNATLLALQKTRSDEMDDDSSGKNQRRSSKEPQYNVTDTYGNAVDVSRDSSSRRGVVVARHTINDADGESIETPLNTGSSFSGALGAAAAAVMGLTGSRSYSGSGPPANVREEIIYVTAPPGKLGVVIDTPSRDTPPIVHAVKEGSVLENEVLVGDKLLAVDDMDVSAMSAVRVSKLISRKSENASRKLTLMRETIEDD